MSEDEYAINNSVEGSLHRAQVVLSKDEYLKHCYTSSGIVGGERDWAYEQILEKLPESELRLAFSLALQEREERNKQKISDTNPISLVPGSEKFAFRGIRRKSNGEAMDGYPDSTITKLYESLYIHGIDNPDSPNMILPRLILDKHTFPTEVGLRRRGEDMAVILVYRNEPFVLPVKKGNETTKLIDLSSVTEQGDIKTISVQEAKAKNYPTLSDNLVGQIEIIIS